MANVVSCYMSYIRSAHRVDKDVKLSNSQVLESVQAPSVQAIIFKRRLAFLARIIAVAPLELKKLVALDFQCARSEQSFLSYVVSDIAFMASTTGKVDELGSVQDCP